MKNVVGIADMLIKLWATDLKKGNIYVRIKTETGKNKANRSKQLFLDCSNEQKVLTLQFIT